MYFLYLKTNILSKFIYLKLLLLFYLFPDFPEHRRPSKPHHDRARGRRRGEEEEQVQPVDASLRIQVQRHHAR